MGFDSAIAGNSSTQPAYGQHPWQPGAMSDILNTTFGQPKPAIDVPTPTPSTSLGQDLGDAWKLPPVVIPPMPTDGGQGAIGKPADPSSDQSVYDASESKGTKVAREGAVLSLGLGRSVLYGMASLPQRLPEIGASMAIGAALSTLSKAGGLGVAATFVVGAYFTSKYIVNLINDTARWNKFGAAVNDTWNSSQHWKKDVKDVSDSGGNVVFDTGLSMASGYMGYNNKALGDLILSVIKLPVPMPPLDVPISPALMGVGMYMDVVPAPFLYKQVVDDDELHRRTAGKN